MRNKAIGLLSGGLDSTLAVKIMIDFGFEVTALHFMSPFCTCTGKNAGCKSEAAKVANNFDIRIRNIFLGEDYLKMIEAPKYGYGKNLNPCLDCRIMMFRKAKEIMIEEGASFIFTGEVLGQRPMSQRRDSMRVIERDSDLEGLILRPLSAKLFDPTVPEREGIVDREKLLEMNGRSRKPQISLADSLGINDYPCAAGGCLLTETGFARKMRDLLRDDRPVTTIDVKLLRIGRHFRLHNGLKAIVGRDEKENDHLGMLAKTNDTLIYVSEYKGPNVLVCGKPNDEDVDIIASIAVRYGSTPDDSDIQVTVEDKSKAVPRFLLSRGLEEEKLSKMRI